ncbi:MAG TPA: response regulator [Anaeromyxobacteraceae bacterium]|nr:response regulator [Anaeromyxobacteraceae bacterium]
MVKLASALVVDDSATQAKATAATLARAGYDPVLVATDWAECRAFLAVKAPDLVVLDVRMGGQMGADVMLPQLRRFPGCAESRFVLYSAIKPADLAAIAKRCNADGCIAKGNEEAFVSLCVRLVP